MISPTLVRAAEVSNEIVQEVSQQRSLSEIEAELESKVLAMGYSSMEEYDSQIGLTIPVEQSLYYNNFEYYNAYTLENHPEKDPLIKPIKPQEKGDIVGYGYNEAGYKVKVAQLLLKEQGYSIDADGYWGPKSESAAKDFQRSIKLSADGVIGKHTWAYLIEHL